MKREISERLLRSPDAAPQSQPFEISDTRLPGFCLRVQPSGRRSYVVRWKRNYRRTLGPAGVLTPATARRRAEIMLGNVFHGRDPDHGLRDHTTGYTLADFMRRVYEPFATEHFSDAQAVLHRLRACFREWYELPMSDLTTPMLQQWVVRRLSCGISGSTVNRDLSALSAALNRAVRWNHLQSNPVAAVERCRVDNNPKTRHLSDNERRRLISALAARDRKARLRRNKSNVYRRKKGLTLLPHIGEYADHLTPLVLLSLNTGCRRGELLSLTWDDVSFQKRTIAVEGARTKNGQTRIIHLNMKACLVLKTCRKAAKSPLVFPGPRKQEMKYLKTAWRRLLSEAQIKNFRWHDMRHTFASDLAMAGVDLNTLRELLGHRDITMTLRYAHLTDEHKKAAVEKLCR